MIINVTSENSGERIDKFLSNLPDIGSRSFIVKLIKSEKILVNGSITKSSYVCETGDEISIEMESQETNEEELTPYDFPLDIAHEDADLIVINKPAGLVMHPAVGHENDTLVNALVHHCKDLSMGSGENRPGIVHRLDKDTSGILVVAKNNETHEALSDQFKERTTHRIYHALVYGHVKFDEKTIESYFIRHPKDRKKYCSEKLIDGQDPKGKKAISHFKCLKHLPNGLSLIQCKLETGRTHQIRIHTSEMGYPIVGDNIYGNSKRSQNLKSIPLRKHIKNMTRVALHAKELGFVHPKTKNEMKFQSDWPENLFELWDGTL